MSYAITEAERKHVAAIEDTRFTLVRKGEAEDTTPLYSLHLTDSDKLDYDIDLPKFKLECTKEDDELSRFRIKVEDDLGNPHEIVFDGLIGNSGNPLGLGWRFKVTFGKDEDGFIDRMIVERKNDHKTWTNEIKSFSDLVIKNLVVGSDTIEGSGNLNVKGETTLEKKLTGTEADFGGVEINSEEYAFKSNEKSSKFGAATIDDLNATKITSNDGQIEVTNAQININSSTLVGDENSHFNVSNLDATNLVSNDATIENLEANKTTSHNTTLDGKTTITDDFTAEKLEVADKIKTKDLNVTNQFEAGTAVMNNAFVSNAITAKSIKSDVANVISETVGESQITKASVSNLSAVDAKAVNLNANNIETHNLKTDNIDVDMIDAEEAEFAKVNTNNIRSLNGENTLISVRENEVSIGDGNTELVLKSAPNGNDPNSITYNKVKVVCGDKSSYLATMEDVHREMVNGVVDLTTSQSIGGVKRFRDNIVAESGIVAPDNHDADKTLNVVSRMWDPNDDVNHTVNPEYAAAQEMVESYDRYEILYNDAAKKYTAADRTQKNYDNIVESLNAVIGVRDSTEAELTTYNGDIATLNTEIADLTTQKTSIEEQIVEKDNAIAVDGGMNTKNELLEKKAASEAATESLEAFATNFNAAMSSEAAATIITGTHSEEILDANLSLSSRIAAFEAYINEYSENDGWETTAEVLCSLLKDYFPDIETLSDIVNKYKGYTDAINEFNSDDAEKLARLLAAEEARTVLLTQKEEVEASISEKNIALEEKTAQANIYQTQYDNAIASITTLEASKAEKEVEKNEKFASYVEAYEAYEGVAPEELIEPALPETKVEGYDYTTYRRFKLGMILELVPDEGHDKIIRVGNAEDELQFESDALENGDEHMQSVIGGHYHKVANYDDIILPSFASKTNDKVVGDTDINATDENEIEFKVTRNKIKKAKSLTPQEEETLEESNQPESETETIFTLKGSESIILEKVEDDENTAVVKFNEEGFENALKGRDPKFDISTENNGAKLDQKYSNGDIADSISIKSDKKHVLIKSDTNKKVDIDVNVYEPDLDLGDETTEGYVKAYKKLEATSETRDFIPNAIAVKALYSDMEAKNIKVKNELDTRVPPSPKIEGRYGLVATVVTNPTGGVSSMYSWDGTVTGLPEVFDTNASAETNTYIEKEVVDLNGQTHIEKIPVTLKNDWNGNPIQFYTKENPVEYIPKMRLVAKVGPDGKTKLTTVVNWMPMDYNGSSTAIPDDDDSGNEGGNDPINHDDFYIGDDDNGGNDPINHDDFYIGDDDDNGGNDPINHDDFYIGDDDNEEIEAYIGD